MSVASNIVPHVDRSTYLGSHDTAAIFGLHPWRKPINVYMEKVGLALPQETSEAMEWGLRNQSAILAKFAEQMQCRLEPERFVRHPVFPWFGGTPDATIAGALSGVDAKNVRFNRGDWGEPMTDQVPEYVAMQAHHFMTLLDYEQWFIAVLFAGCEFRIYQIRREQEISAMILSADAAFWRDHVEAGAAPGNDGSDAWRKYHEVAHPRDNGEMRAPTLEELDLLGKLRHWEAMEEKCKEKGAHLRNLLCASLGDAAGIECGIAKVTYQTRKGATTVDRKKLERDWPDIAQQCLKTGEATRTLRIAFKEGE